MKYNDQYRNVCHRDDARPAVISRLFENSNCVNVNNQICQHNLALEECWVTTDGWFRLFTTFVGITTTDTWFLRECAESRNDAEGNDEKRKIVAFAGDVSESLLDIAAKLEKESPEPNVCMEEIQPSLQSPVSSMTGKSNEHRHTKVWLSAKKGQGGRKTPSQARCMWCSRTEGKTSKTILKCLQCDVGFCPGKTGRKCWQYHVENDGPPPKPVTKRRKRGRTCEIVINA